MKKLCSLLLCAALICTVLAGCPRVQEAERMEPETTEAPTEWVLDMTEAPKPYDGVELRFLSMWPEDAAEADVLNQAAEVFKAETGASVELLWPGEGENADILQLPGADLAAYPDRILDLTQLAETAGYADRSFSSLSEQVIGRCGFLGAIPEIPYVSGFYYNRETFETSSVSDTPQTWEELKTLCAALAQNGWQSLTINSEDEAELLLMHLTQYLGRDAALDTAANGGWQSEGAAAAAADIFDLVSAGFVTTTGQNRLALSSSAITYGTNALCAEVEEATQTDLSWGMFPYPGAGGSEPVITVDVDVLAVSADCAEPQAAFDFILLLTCGEFDQLRADLTEGIPADPANESPIAGAKEALQIAQVLERTQAEWTEDQLKTIGKLWSGSYQENSAFSSAMDALYS